MVKKVDFWLRLKTDGGLTFNQCCIAFNLTTIEMFVFESVLKLYCVPAATWGRGGGAL